MLPLKTPVCAAQFKECLQKIHMLLLHPIRASKLDSVVIGLPLSEQLLKSFQSG